MDKNTNRGNNPQGGNSQEGKGAEKPAVGQSLPPGFNNVTPANTGEVIKGLGEVMKRLKANGLLESIPDEVLEREMKRRSQPEAN